MRSARIVRFPLPCLPALTPMHRKLSDTSARSNSAAGLVSHGSLGGLGK